MNNPEEKRIGTSHDQSGAIHIIGGILLLASIGSTLLILDNRYRFMQLEDKIAEYEKRIESLELEVDDLKLRKFSIGQKP